MKKVLGYVVTLLLAVFPFTLKAVTAEDVKIDLSKYSTMNFREVLAQEEIKEEFTNYSETEDQITIYMFRGNGCGYCRSFLSFLNGITDEYGKYFKVVGFEVWGDQNNNDLLTKISAFMDNPAGGVPYIIIGDQVFPGYASEYDDGIKAAITNLYNSKERYDVFEEYNKAIDQAKKDKYGNAATIIFWNLLFIAAATYIVIRYIKKSNQELLEKLVEVKYTNKPVKEVNSEVIGNKKKNAKKKR